MDDATRQHKERWRWERTAGSYDRRMESTHKSVYGRSIDMVHSVVTPSHHVLEMGCGTGILSLAIAPLVAHVVATDISPKMISVAQEKASRAAITNLTFRIADSYSLPYDDASFDVVLVFNLLHVVKEPAHILLEAHRLLKPDGLLASATHCHAEPVPLGGRLRLFALRLLHRVGIIPFSWRYRKQDLDQLFETCGFAIRETDTLFHEPVNYYLLTEKARAAAQRRRPPCAIS